MERITDLRFGTSVALGPCVILGDFFMLLLPAEELIRDDAPARGWPTWMKRARRIVARRRETGQTWIETLYDNACRRTPTKVRGRIMSRPTSAGPTGPMRITKR
jgi:hypothetical protein